MVPAFGAASGVAVMGDAFTWQTGTGAAAMLIGVSILMLKNNKPKSLKKDST